jgi:hypothetical protein
MVILKKIPGVTLREPTQISLKMKNMWYEKLAVASGADLLFLRTKKQE